MSNKLFTMYGNQNQDPLTTNFQQFMTAMKGKDPTAILNELIQSGKINQQQLNAAQQQAQAMAPRLNMLKGMFGFK